ncbi:hypothetical protein [Paenibacillus piri]|uniref:KTSC domain-containing protein n=1 Tax=Paenibacillus piri TaxID=2547395 RepID=A0A4R5KNU4_9BACL|nr:hypothetical protein [Paenibacillus piri]TDF96347.1 hypothetical protein E1757_18385 [Paenibacillus piri]
MNYITIGCKQIAYVSYDDQTLQMHIRYHTGHSQVCDGIGREQVQQLIQSDNPYDCIMRLIQLSRSLGVQRQPVTFSPS